MNSTRELLQQLADPNLSPDQQTQLRCNLAGQLQEAGRYEAAREILMDFWPRLGERPALEGLPPETQAQLLLRVGALTRDIGSATQMEQAQETAKNLLSETMARFEALRNVPGVAETQIEIAVCYRREGAFDEARVLLQEALSRLGPEDSELRAVALLRSAIVEWSAKRFHDALRILKEATPLFEVTPNQVLKGKFHHGLGFVLRNVAEAEDRSDYVDSALIEYAAAQFYFEQAGLKRYEGCVENNLGFLFGVVGKFAEAHEHLDRAQAIFGTLKDTTNLAQVDDTRSRVLLWEKRIVAAERTARAAVSSLEKGDEKSLLAEALTTHGTALARLQHFSEARWAFERAIGLAEQAGDTQGAGLAALTLLEELGPSLSNDELCIAIDRAAKLLAEVRELVTVRRLGRDACHVLSIVRRHLELPPVVDWTKFSFPDAVRRYEAHFVKLALKDAGGRVTRAARLLRFKRHQLTSLLTRHKDIPVTRRKRSIIRDKTRLSRPANATTTAIRILHVEDHEMVSGVAREMLEKQGWQVETCSDGNVAWGKISSDAHYGLLLVDSALPGVNGLELVRRARTLAHRSRTPIIVLSASPVGAEAREAGADMFLEKPQDIGSLVEKITRLLSEREQEHERT